MPHGSLKLASFFSESGAAIIFAWVERIKIRLSSYSLSNTLWCTVGWSRCRSGGHVFEMTATQRSQTGSASVVAAELSVTKMATHKS